MNVDREVGNDRQMTSIDFGFILSKVKVIGPETVKSFLDDNWRMLGPRVMKVDKEVGHVWQMTPIDFGFIRSKVKVTGARNSKIISG